ILPDYFPDISQILCCNTQTRVLNKHIQGEKLVIDCITETKIYYTCEEKNLHCVDYKMSFTKTCDLKEPIKKAVIHVMPKTDYANCRAVSPRRFEVRGAISLDISVVAIKEEEIICDAKDRCLQLRKNCKQVNQITNERNEICEIEETVDLASKNCEARNIIDYSASACVSDFKAISGKIITKGELCLKVLYYSDEEQPKICSIEYNLPISQIVDCDGANENSSVIVMYDVSSINLQPKPRLDGMISEICVEAKINVCVISHNENKIQSVTDCYFTKFQCIPKYKNISLYNLQEIEKDKSVFKNTISLPKGICQIISVKEECSEKSFTYKDGTICFVTNIIVHIFGRDAEGDIKHIEDKQEFVYKRNIQLNSADVRGFLKSSILCSSYSMSGDCSLEYRCEVCIGGGIYTVTKEKVIYEIEQGEEKENTASNNCCLKVYFASKGECVWDIAKKYNTSIDSVVEENGIEGDELDEKMMLLIPII
ncbi:MAG: DUF3794 domain-containing protein, partial [Oscillospiraceae bacterium]